MLGLKIGEYYSGISSDILQFYLGDLSHGTHLDQSGARKNISCIMMGFILEVYL